MTTFNDTHLDGCNSETVRLNMAPVLDALYAKGYRDCLSVELPDDGYIEVSNTDLCIKYLEEKHRLVIDKGWMLSAVSESDKTEGNKSDGEEDKEEDKEENDSRKTPTLRDLSDGESLTVFRKLN